MTPILDLYSMLAHSHAGEGLPCIHSPALRDIKHISIQRHIDGPLRIRAIIQPKLLVCQMDRPSLVVDRPQRQPLPVLALQHYSTATHHPSGDDISPGEPRPATPQHAVAGDEVAQQAAEQEQAGRDAHAVEREPGGLSEDGCRAWSAVWSGRSG